MANQKPSFTLEPTTNDVSKMATAMNSMAERQPNGPYARYVPLIRNILTVAMDMPTAKVDLQAPAKSSVPLSQVQGTTFNKGTNRKPDADVPKPLATPDSSTKFGM
ncbi:MAG: hypothetical protein CK424_04225 [Legionella sp.]|nr:MAG: hypothetical protein CK424_04225 [Legionella sp.]